YISCIVQLSIECWLQLAVITKSFQSCWRKRIYSIRTNKLINIQRVGVSRILCPGACPQQSLCLCTFCLQDFPAVTGNALFVNLVSQPSFLKCQRSCYGGV